MAGLFAAAHRQFLVSMPSDQINTLLSWCSANGIQIDPRLQINDTVYAGIGVFSHDADIGCNSTRTSIPSLGGRVIVYAGATSHRGCQHLMDTTTF